MYKITYEHWSGYYRVYYKKKWWNFWAMVGVDLFLSDAIALRDYHKKVLHDQT